MIVDYAIAADAATPTLAVAIDDARLADRVRRFARQSGFAVVSERAAAGVLVVDRMQRAPMPVVVIGTASIVAAAMQDGASGGLRPGFSARQLERTLLAVASGLICTDVPVRAWRPDAGPPARRADVHALADDTDSLAAPLTARESEVLALLVTGASNKEIARALAVTVHTAKFHVAAIIAKLGAKGRTDAVARALSAGTEMV